MADKERAAAEKGISDEEMLANQRKRNQQEADARLATSPTRQTGVNMLRAAEAQAAATAAAAGARAGKQLDVAATAAPSSDIGSSLAFVTQLSFQDL